MDLIPSNEYVEFEDRVYNNPQVGVDETNTFIDQLRATQGQQNQQILSDTQALGTDVPSNLGGLTGGESYFTSRYQTAPTVSATQNLRTAAQAAALNDVLANEQAIWKKRYQDAYRNYQKRQNNGDDPTPDATKGGVDYEDTSQPTKKVGSVEPSYSPAGSGTFEYSLDTIKTNDNGLFKTNDRFNQQNSIFGGDVEIQRDKFGNVTSITQGGKTFTGEAAQKKYKALQTAGTISGRK